MQIDDWLAAIHAGTWPPASIDWAKNAQNNAAMAHDRVQQCLREGNFEMARWYQLQSAMEYSAAAKATERACNDVAEWRAHHALAPRDIFAIMRGDNRRIAEDFLNERANH
jgi:hypothetical protein